MLHILRKELLLQIVQSGELDSLLEKPAEAFPEALAPFLGTTPDDENEEDERGTSEVSEEEREEEKRLEEIAAKMRDPKTGVPTKTELKGLTVLKNVFSGADALDWLLHNGEVSPSYRIALHWLEQTAELLEEGCAWCGS